MYRKRKFKGTWFPTIGSSSGESPDVKWTNAREAIVDTDGNGVIVVGIASIIIDIPSEPDTDDTTRLSDLIGNEYALRRIVGKIYCRVEETYSTGDQYPLSYMAAAGLFVARAGDARSDSGEGAGSPIGGPSTWETDYNPLEPQCIREPWIWRRTWLLGSPLAQENFRDAAAPVVSRVIGLPTANTQYGSVADGPHVDARTRRRVGQDDRLWLAYAAHPLPFGYTSPNNVYGNVVFNWDFRVFGALRKARNRGNF